MRKLLAWVLVVSLTTPLGGCFSIRHSVEDSFTPVEFSHSDGDRRYHFEEEGRNYYILYGLIPVYQAKTESILEKHVRKGTRLSNLKVEQAFAPTDIAVTLGFNVLGSFLTFGIAPMIGFSTRTVHYEGDVVNTEEGSDQ